MPDTGVPMTLDGLFALLAANGGAEYHGEAVSQLQHALQSAALAESEGAPPALIAAALFHDIGHLTAGLGEDAAERGIDDVHEDRGAAVLAAILPSSVSEPVRMHVAAKRCLCAIDPGYHAGLSPASRRSLDLQGGVMSEAEAASFRALPYGEDALRLRRWDDLAKNPGAETPGLDHYRALLAAAL